MNPRLAAFVLTLLQPLTLTAQPVAARQAEFAKLPLPAELGAVPVLKCPLYIQEFHIWYSTPFGSPSAARHGYVHGGDNELADTLTVSPDWLRARHSVGYPLTGLYSSANTDIIRWQFRCLKATGVDGVFIQLFPEWHRGDTFVFEPIFEEMLAIAATEGLKIGIHDEVQFRPGRPAQQPDIMVQRLSAFLKKYAKHPAYLTISGRPAVVFQYWSYFDNKVQPQEMQQIFQRVNSSAGENIFWIPSRSVSANSELLAMPEVGGVITIANSNAQFRSVSALPQDKLPSYFGLPTVIGYVNDPLPDPLTVGAVKQFRDAADAHPDKQIGLWGYAGFENSTLHGNREQVGWLPRHRGKTLVDLLQFYHQQNPSFIILSSWNDWEENTALEPGIDYDGYNGDPYLYCRILAAAKGKQFIPPPLPPKESLDPLMWQPLFGIDKTPPTVTAVRYAPLEPALVATVSDSASAVQKAELLAEGDACLTVSGSEKFSANTPLTLTLSPEVFRANGGACYIAVEFLDDTKGKLNVRYPSEHELVDWLPSDEQKFKVGPAITLNGSGEWRAAVRLLRGIDWSKMPLTLTIAYQPVAGETKPPRVTRVHVFQAMTNAQAGVEISFAAADSQVKTYRFPSPDLLTTPPRAAYLIVTDSAGNRSAPIPAFGGEKK